MKKTMLLSFVFIFSLFVASCNNDDDDDSGGPSGGNENPQGNTDPTFTAFISGDITDTISFTVPDGIFKNHTIIGSYVGVVDLLTINVMELPTGYQLNLAGQRSSFGEGDYIGSQDGGGFGAYNDSDQNRAFSGTACTVTIESTELIQDVVQASYEANGSFTMTLEDMSNPPRVIEINGTFENIPLSVNE